MRKADTLPDLNVVTQLIAFTLIAISLSQAKVYLLLVVLIILVLANILTQQQHFFRLIKRLRWFFIVMWLIYAFNTPGEYWRILPVSISPTYEGVQGGALQLLRILIMLSAVSLLLIGNTRQQLISGFYFMLRPFKVLGVDAERFAARLWLTMYYVEKQPTLVQGPHFVDFIRQTLEDAINESEKDQMNIQWEEPKFNFCDKACIILMAYMIFFLVRN
ncbi:MAG TPA: CbiQ family ECF transporter T component [Methylophilus sp.]|nr:CbiQ family ECF transporter T component [Rugosibacter sp.]HQN65251.1 CbiQ family ECF transporter T component [Methylophilus sp.]HQQ34248.1 CbiQ family ECF transporter T component [Methylophilus sp.]